MVITFFVCAPNEPNSIQNSIGFLSFCVFGRMVFMDKKKTTTTVQWLLEVLQKFLCLVRKPKPPERPQSVSRNGSLEKSRVWICVRLVVVYSEKRVKSRNSLVVYAVRHHAINYSIWTTSSYRDSTSLTSDRCVTSINNNNVLTFGFA